jgi:dihydroorotate dehydrogenase (fumarate)
MLEALERWMAHKEYESPSQFKGRMNAQEAGGYTNFERTQFMKYFSGREE